MVNSDTGMGDKLAASLIKKQHFLKKITGFKADKEGREQMEPLKDDSTFGIFRAIYNLTHSYLTEGRSRKQ